MTSYNLKEPEEVKDYLKNLHIEYKFGCYKEKNPEGKDTGIANNSNLLIRTFCIFVLALLTILTF